ncbi:MAG TPA: DUF885 family protein, partial [Kofleriaceae bacterium]|nr:DUF885 family protein [Kofleriaceae bacterium]
MTTGIASPSAPRASDPTVLAGLDHVADEQGLVPHAEVTRWIDHEIAALAAGSFHRTLPANQRRCARPRRPRTLLGCGMLRFAVVLSVLGACGGAAPSGGNATEPAGRKPAAPEVAFTQFVDEFFDAGNRYSPSDAVGNGFHAFDAQIEDRSRARIDQRIAELHGFQDRLAAIDHSALGFDSAIDAQAIEFEIKGELLSLEVTRPWANNPMPYAGIPGGAIDVLMKRDFAPRKDRLRAMVARLRGVPAIYAAARANLGEPPKEFTDVALGMAKGTSGFFEGPVAAWARASAAGDTALFAEFDTANRAAIAASRAFVEWLENDLMPRSHGRYAIGEARFLDKLRFEEMVDLPLADLLAKGEANL